MIQQIKNTIGKFQLKRFVKSSKSKGKPRFTNLNSALSIGLVFTAESETDLTLINKFYKKLSVEEGIQKVKVIGFIPEKELPDYTKRFPELNFFCLQDLKFWLEPQPDAIDGFTKYQYDILMNLNLHKSLVIDWVIASTKAKLTTGKRGATQMIQPDLIIDLSGSESLPLLIEQTIHFTKMINPKNSSV